MFPQKTTAVLFALSILCAQGALAEDYYWSVTGSGMKFTSAQSACQHVFDTSNLASRAASGVNAVASGSRIYRCEAFYRDNLGFVGKSLLALTKLRGNGCSAGGNFQNADPTLPVC